MVSHPPRTLPLYHFRMCVADNVDFLPIPLGSHFYSFCFPTGGLPVGLWSPLFQGLEPEVLGTYIPQGWPLTNDSQAW